MQAALIPVQEFAHCKYEQRERGGEGKEGMNGSDREEKEKKKNKKKNREPKKRGASPSPNIKSIMKNNKPLCFLDSV
jgi:hypothetical protein